MCAAPSLRLSPTAGENKQDTSHHLLRGSRESSMKRFFMSVVAVAIVGLSAGEQAWAKGPVGTSGQGGFTKGGFTPGGGAQGNLGGIGQGIPPVGQSINPKFVKPD